MHKPAATLRLSLPDSKPKGRRREFHIQFRDPAMYQHALQLLWTRAEAEMYDIPPTSDPVELESHIAVAINRKKAAELLEGVRRPPRPTQNYKRIFGTVEKKIYMCRGEQWAGHFWAHEVQIDPDHGFEEQEETPSLREAPPFSWRQFHHVLSAELAEHNREWFPALSEKQQFATYLALGAKNQDGSQDVVRAFDLQGRNLRDLVITSWGDMEQELQSVIWIGETWDDIPTETYSPGYPIVMDWGTDMF